MIVNLFGRRGGQPAKSGSSLDWILVFLGNPGDQYENTRHNVGFLAADALGERLNKPIQRLKFKALTNVVEYGGCRVLLMKPVTYMNLSGEAVGEAARCFAGLEGADMVQVAVTRTRPAGRYHLMDAQNPVWIFSGEGRA